LGVGLLARTAAASRAGGKHQGRMFCKSFAACRARCCQREQCSPSRLSEPRPLPPVRAPLRRIVYCIHRCGPFCLRTTQMRLEKALRGPGVEIYHQTQLLSPSSHIRMLRVPAGVPTVLLAWLVSKSGSPQDELALWLEHDRREAMRPCFGPVSQNKCSRRRSQVKLRARDSRAVNTKRAFVKLWFCHAEDQVTYLHRAAVRQSRFACGVLRNSTAS
jgi:hypothetical protein